MIEFWNEYLGSIPGTYQALAFAYLSLVLSWPLFLLLEKITPVIKNTPRANYWLNWRITASNLLLAPVFSALITLLTVYAAGGLGFPSLKLAPVTLSVGIPVADILIQGSIIFVLACIMGDFSYYWWHRLQHKIPFLWELHKLHHSDENLNTTTIYRSHFLEPAGQALFRGLTIGLIVDASAQPITLMSIFFGGLLLVIWDYFIHANVRIDALNRMMPFFSVPQFHWIHHSKLPEHQDKNFSIWLPIYDVIFGSYYKPAVDEYPPTGLSSGEKIETVWEAQTGPFVAWAQSIKKHFASKRRSARESS